ncbi:HEPN domain-containing protein [bacterium]|nr:HEPN domain-containing protein [bacterium]MBU0899904.1 HEPN domain-containing protein [bacterium]MBU1153190.1 HEPN domain-containing protein [bacterium]MBU2599931.1 HEPN domain-containing protein [bacterium]
MERIFCKEEQAKSCFKTANRHLEMANFLLEKEYFEGAIFHIYHALESSCVAGIILKGEKIPKKHYLKIPRFKSLYPSFPFSDELNTVVESLSPERDKALYLGIDSSWSLDSYTKEDMEEALEDTKGIVDKLEAYLFSKENIDG